MRSNAARGRKALPCRRAPRSPARTRTAGPGGRERSSHHGIEKRALAHSRRRVRRKNGRFWRAQFCTEVAHPTRFERMASAFGGQRSCAANRGTTFSTNRKNRDCEPPATIASYEPRSQVQTLSLAVKGCCVPPRPIAHKLARRAMDASWGCVNGALVSLRPRRTSALRLAQMAWILSSRSIFNYDSQSH